MMKTINLNDDYILLCPDDCEDSALDLVMNVVENNSQADAITFDYYVKDDTNKKLVRHWVNRYTILERYMFPLYLAVKKWVFRDDLTRHCLLLRTIAYGGTVHNCRATIGIADSNDVKCPNTEVFYEKSKAYLNILHCGDYVITNDGDKNELSCRYFLFQDERVAIIIITSTLELLKTCIDSLYFNCNKNNTDIFVGIYKKGDISDLVAYVEEESLVVGYEVFDFPKFNYSQLNNLMFSQFVDPKLYRYTMLMNDDIEIVNPNFIGEMRTLIVKEGATIVGAQLLYPFNQYDREEWKTRRYQHGGIVLGSKSTHFEHFGRNKLVEMFYVPTREVSAVTFAVVMIKTGYFRKEQLNEEFWGDCNDVEYCLRAREAGEKIWYCAGAVAIHNESATRRDDPAMQNDKNSPLFFRRNQNRLKRKFDLI